MVQEFWNNHFAACFVAHKPEKYECTAGQKNKGKENVT